MPITAYIPERVRRHWAGLLLALVSLIALLLDHTAVSTVTAVAAVWIVKRRGRRRTPPTPRPASYAATAPQQRSRTSARVSPPRTRPTTQAEGYPWAGTSPRRGPSASGSSPTAIPPSWWSGRRGPARPPGCSPPQSSPPPDPCSLRRSSPTSRR